MKATKVLGIIMAAGLLAGCGQASDNGSTANQSQTNTSAPSSSQSTSDVQNGVKSMLTLTSTMDSAIQAGDVAKASETGTSLEDAWHGFEDQVHAKYAADYAKVEQYLDPLEAGAKVTPMDKKTLSGLNAQLRQALQTLQQHLS